MFKTQQNQIVSKFIYKYTKVSSTCSVVGVKQTQNCDLKWTVRQLIIIKITYERHLTFLFQETFVGTNVSRNSCPSIRVQFGTRLSLDWLVWQQFFCDLQNVAYKVICRSQKGTFVLLSTHIFTSLSFVIDTGPAHQKNFFIPKVKQWNKASLFACPNCDCARLVPLRFSFSVEAKDPLPQCNHVWQYALVNSITYAERILDIFYPKRSYNLITEPPTLCDLIYLLI